MKRAFLKCYEKGSLLLLMFVFILHKIEAMENITKTYTNGEITIVWKPSVCIHSTICWKGLGGLTDVFNPRERPWIKPYGATTERIMEQINKCPSGALSYYKNGEGKAEK